MITARRLPFDPLLAAMAAGLALAVGAMAYTAFRGNPWSAPGMILILTAGLIAQVGLRRRLAGEDGAQRNQGHAPRNPRLARQRSGAWRDAKRQQYGGEKSGAATRHDGVA